MELRGRLRMPNETRLMVIAYPDLDAMSREVVACDYFLDSIDDPGMKLKIREKNPATLDEALKVALLLEVWSKDAAHGKQSEKGNKWSVNVVRHDDSSELKELIHNVQLFADCMESFWIF